MLVFRVIIAVAAIAGIVRVASGGEKPDAYEPPAVNEPVAVFIQPAVEFSPPARLTYSESYRLAEKGRLPMITFIGANGRSLEAVEGHVVTALKSMDGFIDGDKLTAEWQGDKLVVVKVENSDRAQQSLSVPGIKIENLNRVQQFLLTTGRCIGTR